MTYRNLQTAARNLLAARPDLLRRIQGILEMARDEIANGGSEHHETELALRDLASLSEA